MPPSHASSSRPCSLADTCVQEPGEPSTSTQRLVHIYTGTRPLTQDPLESPTEQSVPMLNLACSTPEELLHLEITQQQFVLSHLSDTESIDDPSTLDSLSSSTTSPCGPSYPKEINLSKSRKQLTLPTMADRMTKFKTTDGRAP